MNIYTCVSACVKGEAGGRAPAEGSQQQEENHRVYRPRHQGSINIRGRGGHAVSIYPSINLTICLSVCLSVYLSIYQSINLTIYLSVCLSIYLSIYLCSYVCEYVYLCVGADNFRGRGGPDPQDRQLLRSSRRRWLRCVSVRVSE